MRKLLLALVGMAMMSAAALLVARADAAISTAPVSMATIAAETTSVEQVATCFRRRVCGPRGCAWRTVCRRWR
jgi:hypothetical protein